MTCENLWILNPFLQAAKMLDISRTLAPCPVCKGEATLRYEIRQDEKSMYTVMFAKCMSCGEKTAECQNVTPEQVAEMWNRRSNDEAHDH